jgi:hypothetical protein
MYAMDDDAPANPMVHLPVIRSSGSTRIKWVRQLEIEDIEAADPMIIDGRLRETCNVSVYLEGTYRVATNAAALMERVDWFAAV